MISNLLKVCIVAMEGDYPSKRSIPDPEYGTTEDVLERNDYVRQTLTIANRLMSWGEEALLDHINKFYRDKKN